MSLSTASITPLHRLLILLYNLTVLTWGGVVNIPDKVNDGNGNVFTVNQTVMKGILIPNATELHFPSTMAFVVMQGDCPANVKGIYLSKGVGLLSIDTRFTTNIYRQGKSVLHSRRQPFYI